MTHFVTQTQSALSPDLTLAADRLTRGRSQASTISLPWGLSTLVALGVLSIASFSPQLSSPAIAQSYPTLTSGTTDAAVSQLQATLKLLGFYTGEVNGTYDQSTLNAVAQFQAAAGIAADGVTGQSTWQKLLPTPSDVAATATQPAAHSPESAETDEISSGPPILRAEAEGSAVAQLQRELQALGYYDGVIDGGFGAQTLAAVKQFQTDQQIFVDGVVGGATWEALSRALEGLQ